jgi:myosin protein heavy chain
MQLEQEKRKVEEQLEAERAFALEKDALLERSKKQEADLEEEIVAMQADLEAVDGQLERALAGHKAMEENFRVAKMNFEEASRHLQRLEGAEGEWKIKEVELCEALRKATMQLEDLAHAKDDLGKTEEDLRRSLKEKEEDISRVRERLESTVGDLEAKLTQAVKARYVLTLCDKSQILILCCSEVSKRRAEALEEEARHAKDQLAELSRTATDYSGMIQKKEAEMASLAAELTTVRRERDSSVKQAIELQGQIDTIAKELAAIEGDRERDVQARRKLQSELDELRKRMETKTSEETKRSEVERSKEQELATLRSQASKLQDQLSEDRRQRLETQNKLKVELEAVNRERSGLDVAHKALLEKEKLSSAKHQELDDSLADAVRSKRVLESELQAVRTRQVDMENQLAETIRSREVGLLI